MTKPKIQSMSLERVRELLDYNADTGEFRWKTARAGANQKSKVGTVKRGGYLLIGIDREHVLAHRLALFYVNGEWPPAGVDHIDGDPANNRLANLRQASQAVNLQNLRGPKCNSKAGILGVSHCARDNNWRARIQVEGVRKTFYAKSKEEAARKYLEAKRKLHPGCTI